ncbi:MBG-2 domain-containing protein, partial [Gluconacetobacter sp. 1c LMG 22058]
YGQAPALGTSGFSAAGLVNGDTVSSVSLATAATGASSVGSYGITAAGATGSGLSNYTVTYRSGTLTIDPAALTVTALDQTSTYGQAPALGTSRFSTTGLVNGDAVSAVNLTTAATGASTVGTYAIAPSTATGTGLSNYHVSYRLGSLTIVMGPSSATAGLSADLRSQGIDSLTGIVSQGLNTAFVADHVSAIANLSGISSAHENSGSSTVVSPLDSAAPDEIQKPAARSILTRPSGAARTAAPARAVSLSARLTSRNNGNIVTPRPSARNQIAR